MLSIKKEANLPMSETDDGRLVTNGDGDLRWSLLTACKRRREFA